MKQTAELPPSTAPSKGPALQSRYQTAVGVGHLGEGWYFLGKATLPAEGISQSRVSVAAGCCDPLGTCCCGHYRLCGGQVRRV